jgi:hypothetical protein
MEVPSRPCEFFASERSHRIVTHCWQRRLARAGMLAAMKLLPPLFWLAFATGALLAGYAGLDLRLLSAGCVGMAALAGSDVLNKGKS